ncbi:Nramp family divalent metal transporter [Mycobacterium leprae]|uniref:Nramp family divalent metal transporter n=1 Tax=Mycobacterium leprae TaxID=1769 RepID=UPI0002F2054E|nr:divalent metal cation transporter [Mycobacterium leprae 3125609]OAX70560.1 divalent metal cation transporter [Mycobacterium leprae 7935681]
MAESTQAELKTSWYLLGPAFVAAIAYVDPGNVAANVSSGAQFGYLQLWVVVVANVLAGLVQYLSAKLGLVTGQSLPQAISKQMSHPFRLGFWLQAELVAMATDVAEIVGGAIAFHILFRVSLLLGGVITGTVSLLLLMVKDRRGQLLFERVITGLLFVIVVGFTSSFFVATPSPEDMVNGLLPRFQGTESVLLAAAIIGATVMPHAVYLHSGLALDRHGHPHAGRSRRRLLRVTRLDVILAMTIAGIVNTAMLLVAAINLQHHQVTAYIEGTYTAIQDTLGATIAMLFAIGLLASSLASASVGAYAGALIMQGLLQRSIPMLIRRLITLCPAIAILALGFDPTRALVLSQIVLSFGIPFAVLPLVKLTNNRGLMGNDTNHPATTVLGWAVAILVSLLNVVLIYLTVTS